MAKTEVTVEQYYQSKTTMLAKIQALDNLIDSMTIKLATAAGNSDVVNYTMDDGQVRITAEYRNPNQLIATINGLEAVRQRYLNRHNGSITVLRGRLKFR